MKAKDTVLTKEEREALILAAPHPSGQHLNNAEIGERLGIPITKVKTLIRNACIKLGAHNRNEAIFFAVRRGEMRPDEFYSLDELAQLFCTYHPDMFKRISHLVHKGHEYLLDADEQNIPMDGRQDKILTKSEQDTLILVGRGLTNREIADTLYVSLYAVSTFIYRACTKLGAHNRVDAVVFALKRGEISMGDIYSSNELIRALATLDAESLEKIAQLLAREPGREPVTTVI